MKKGGRYLNAAPVKKKKGKRIALIIFLTLVLLISAAAVVGVIYYNSMLNLITRPVATEHSLSEDELVEILGFVPETIPPEERAEEATQETVKQEQNGVKDPIVNIMLIGQHRQKGEDSKLSDTLILCSMNKETKTLTLTSFQRDLYIKLPNYKNHVCGKNRINVAYNLGWRWAGEMGGMEMLDQLIYENFGVDVDYNFEVGFDAFTEAIDVIGGIEITMDAKEARALELGGAGTYVLDGEKALEYARLRRTDNDFYRTNRQRNVITAVINKARTMTIPQLNSLLKQLLPLLITDMTNEQITSLALELLPMLPELKIESQQCPVDGTYWFEMLDIAGIPSSVIICELEPNRELLMAVAEPAAEE